MNSRELRELVLSRDVMCQYPGCFRGDWQALTLAHRIKQGVGSENYVVDFWRANFGECITRKKARGILNHPLNVVLACPGAHNDWFNIFHNERKRDDLLLEIERSLRFSSC